MGWVTLLHFCRVCRTLWCVPESPDLISFAWHRDYVSNKERTEIMNSHLYSHWAEDWERAHAGYGCGFAHFEVLGPESWEGRAPLSWTIQTVVRGDLEGCLVWEEDWKILFHFIFFFWLCPLKEWEQFFSFLHSWFCESDDLIHMFSLISWQWNTAH